MGRGLKICGEWVRGSGDEAHQAGVGGVDNSIHLQRCDIALEQADELGCLLGQREHG